MSIQSIKKFGLYLGASLAVPALTFAAEFDVPATQTTGGIRRFDDIVAVIERLTNWVFIILLVLAVLFIIMAAFSYLTAGGDEEKVAKAHQKIIYSVVALAVAFLAKGVSFIVAQLLGQSG
jgi:hypothetical protein